MNRDRRATGGEDPEALAIAALGHLAGATDQMSRFLALTGLEPDQLRHQAESPAFLTGVLDFVLADESLLLAFCANCRIDPRDVAPARAALAGDSRP